ncbi:Transcriptional modulator of MazE/toxin, MazF [Candidatus Defluviicoccus seviourii]|uniref:Transcriptional modulator of MazE/toxin, MazF n=2 Tax=root TaxID=1 RepID=A0A564WAH0_9PROT|nr:Transcriptional modulator of MazE/toxin, MazF [uncultured Defluviicoccus sp.]SUS07531.1 Transcriptional modulator of MazE/toxin, MazF [uncultured Defluviicoccus sp.]VUX44942.1 Transcriptional modulator of MazE/toxin, MazF [Candidatus Defluviicoccus seviourii]
MKRGDIVLVTAPGDYGKRRPAVVIQSDLFNDTHASIVVCLISSALVDAPLFRLTIAPSADNGLKEPSQIMVDKMVALRRERLSEPLGRLDDEMMLRLGRSLALFIGLGG